MDPTEGPARGGAGRGGAVGAPVVGGGGAGSEAPRERTGKTQLTGRYKGIRAGSGRHPGVCGGGRGTGSGPQRAGQDWALGSASRGLGPEERGKEAALTPHSWRPQLTRFLQNRIRPPIPHSRPGFPGEPRTLRPVETTVPLATPSQPGRAWLVDGPGVVGAQGSASGSLSSAETGLGAPRPVFKEPKRGSQSWASLLP